MARIDFDAVIERAYETGYNPLEDDDPLETAYTITVSYINEQAHKDFDRVMADLSGYPQHVNSPETRLDTATTYAGVVQPTLWQVFDAMMDNGTIDAEAFWRTYDSLLATSRRGYTELPPRS